MSHGDGAASNGAQKPWHASTHNGPPNVAVPAVHPPEHAKTHNA